MTISTTHLVLLPTYNTGPRLLAVVREALSHWQPLLVVVDGSTDGSEVAVRELARAEPALSVLVLPRNCGKGAAVLAGAGAARERGFTHALVMDADGQHPAASIAEFMSASQRAPEKLILGQPIFPANTPPERLHGRKLSVALVWLELLGPGIADPLFGFRVYPLEPLLEILGPRRGGRRYDFDTEAAVRLGWAGVPLRNLVAPVRYFSRAEGGVSHFHYGRDNLLLVWLHVRLIAELLVVRWPALRRHRRRWQAAGALLTVLLVYGGDAPLAGAEKESPVSPERRLAPGAPDWADLQAAFAHHADVTADFTERRTFPFKREPVELRGEVRVSTERGLSLNYTTPEQRTVILDARGLLVRSAGRQETPPTDPRAAATNQALLHVLRLDFAALEKDYELSGHRDDVAWTLVLVARTEELRRGMGRITVTGAADHVRAISLRRSARQVIDIAIAPPRPPAAFTAEELKKYFR